MMKRMRMQAAILLLAAIVASLNAPLALAGSRDQLVRDANRALKDLYATNSMAKLLGGKAKGILVFPNIVKAGFMFGGQMGDGVLTKKGKIAGYYNSVAASYGLQAGVQVFGYALFFMNDAALAYLDKSGGWEVGVGPSIVVVDTGAGKSMTTTTLTQDVYAFIFRSEGPDGRHRHSGLEDHEDSPIRETIAAQNDADEEGSQHHVEDTPLARLRLDPRPFRRRRAALRSLAARRRRPTWMS